MSVNRGDVLRCYQRSEPCLRNWLWVCWAGRCAWLSVQQVTAKMHHSQLLLYMKACVALIYEYNDLYLNTNRTIQYKQGTVTGQVLHFLSAIVNHFNECCFFFFLKKSLPPLFPKLKDNMSTWLSQKVFFFFCRDAVTQDKWHLVFEWGRGRRGIIV